MTTIIPTNLVSRIDACPCGESSWSEWEQVCIDVLTYAFVPPLKEPVIRSKVVAGLGRRDAVFPNRNQTLDTMWGQLREELNARMVLVDFANHDGVSVGKDDVDQTRLCLNSPMGKLALVCCRKAPDESAVRRRNQLFAQEGKVLLFFTEKELKELVFMREREADPGSLVMDLVERFYMQHE